MVAVIFFVISLMVGYVLSESCFYKKCIGCRPEAAFEAGTPVECHPENWVTPDWFHDIGAPPPGTSHRIPLEYRCLKIVATPEDGSLSRTIDVIKGCIPRIKEDSICKSISAVQRSRGLPNVRCLSCRGDNCNKGILPKGNLYSTFVVLILLILFK